MVVLLGTRASGAREVRVYASEPPAITTRTPPDGVTADSAAIYLALADSALSLDSAFQRERAALNDEAVAMRRDDRRSAGYRSRYQAFERRYADATALRARRDSLRQRLTSIERRHPALARYGTRAATPPVAAARRATIRGDTVRLSLPPGRWWIALDTPAPATEVLVARASRDTIHLP